jgi:flagellar biosynthesis protein FlhG
MLFQDKKAGLSSSSQELHGAQFRAKSRVDLDLPTDIMAQRHRSWVLGLPPQCAVPLASRPLILAIGGGKGGVGKSLLAANLAARLANMGLRVAALDLDCGGANLHTYFGMNSVPANLGDFVVQEKSDLFGVLSPTSIDGLSIASSQRDDAWAIADSLSGEGFGRLWNGINSLGESGFHVVLLDLGAGTSRHTIDLFCCAHAGIVTALPEPTSVENAYLFMRTVFMRLMSHSAYRLGRASEGAGIIAALNQDISGSTGRSYTDKLRMLYQTNPAIVGPMAGALSGRLVGIIINQTRSQADIDIGKAMEMAAQSYFGFASSYLGFLNYDEAAWKSLRNKRLLLVDFPQSIIVRRLNEAANVLLRGCGINLGGLAGVGNGMNFRPTGSSPGYSVG